MKKWVGYIALGIAGLLLWGAASTIGKLAGKSSVRDYEQGKMDGVVEEVQTQLVKEFRKQLPMRIDKITVLESVASAGKTLIYNYSIDAKKIEIDQKTFISKMKNNLMHNVCGQEKMAWAIKQGASYIYSYYASDGLVIGNFEIGKRECGIN
jgi:hypothetical protein